MQFKPKTPFYYCNQCKKICDSLDNLFFVEDGSPKGFCSEVCIEEFYSGLVNYYREMEEALRAEYEITDEKCLQFVGDANLMTEVLQKPDEVWRLENELKEEIFSFIKPFQNSNKQQFYKIVICLVFNFKPSFILATTTTMDLRFLADYRIGETVNDQQYFWPSSRQEIEIEPEIISLLENKKSSFLAALMQNRNTADIPFEHFNQYEDFMQNTLDTPDEVYSDKDDEGDIISTYIKAHAQNGSSFYYFVICLNCITNAEEMQIPIISFPSQDANLYHTLQRGTRITGITKS